MREGQHFLSEKIPKFPIPPPPQEKTYLPLIQKTLSMKWGGDFFFGSHASKSGFSCVLSHFCLLLLMLIFKCCRYNLFIEPTDLKRKEKKKSHLFLETSFEILHSYLVSLDWFHMFCLRLMFPTSTGKSPSRIFLLTFHCGKRVSRWAFQQVMSFSESDNVTSR